MTKAEIIEVLNNYLNLDSRVKFLENKLTVKKEENKFHDPVSIYKPNEKCKSIYTKSELAHLFYLLMEEKILYFDAIDEKNNRGKLQDFLVKNFTYAGDAGSQVAMSSISKQFSECKGYCYKAKYIKFLDKLIVKIQERKERLSSW